MIKSASDSVTTLTEAVVYPDGAYFFLQFIKLLFSLAFEGPNPLNNSLLPRNSYLANPGYQYV